MDGSMIAAEVLASFGGAGNVVANGICMTRLRVIVDDGAAVDTERLSATRGVLGIVKRGSRGYEVVFGPSLIEDVFTSFSSLTGKADGEGDLSAFDGAPVSTIQVQISPSKRMSFDAQADARRTAGTALPAPSLADAPRDEAGISPLAANDEVDLSSLVDPLGLAGALLDEETDDDRILQDFLDEEDAAEEPPAEAPARLLVINGPNLNMLGVREPAIYGREDYATLLRRCAEWAREAGFADCTCLQSNHEGDLIDAIQDAYGTYAGIVINPAAYTHTSIALLDALKAVGLPAVEVHISDVDSREEFRQVSYVRLACIETVAGLGFGSYRKAIFDLAEHLGL